MEDNKGLSYFFLGLGIGVAVGMMFAPTAGAETRTLLRVRASEGADSIRRRGSQLREGATGLVDRGREFVNRQRDNVASSVQAGKQAYSDTMTGNVGTTGAIDVTTPSEGI
jgi:gas vesicle protein